MYRLIYADRGNAATIKQALKDTLDTFRRLTPTEVARLRPLRIDIVAARGNDTVGLLASRMSGIERKLELFQLLNGLSPEDALVPGQAVKLVVD
jgi:predicted Zn-dependent protease